MNANPMNLAGRTILVTGASSGLGRGVVELLANLGARVVLVGRDHGRLESVALGLIGGPHAVEPYDLQQTDGIATWLRDVAGRTGRLNGLVHSAGILTTKPLRMQSVVDWDAALRINVTAGGALAKGFRQAEVHAGAGSIVFVSSVMGLVGQPAQIIYSATKGALIAMTRSMAIEVAREGIRVNTVCPAVVQAGMGDQLRRSMTPEQFAHMTALHPLGLGRPEDVANAVAFLIADTSRWITGTSLIVDGGYTAQ